MEDQLIRTLEERISGKDKFIIGIDGFGGSGKTTLAKVLEKRLGFLRLSIDEVKFEMGYKDISDSKIPDETWEKIFDELDRRIIENLKQGKTILNEYAWFRKQDRNRARKLADDLGIETKIIFVDTPEHIIRERLRKNSKTPERFDIPDDVFEEALKLFDAPTEDENVIHYNQNYNLEDWIKENFK